MTKARLRLVAFYLTVVSLGLGQNAIADVLPLQPIPQRGKLWCWAASSEMVLDYLAPGPVYRAAAGQCSLVRSLPQASCDCSAPDGFNMNDPGCDQRTPFVPDDFVPKLIENVQRTAPPAGTFKAISTNLLTCEIKTRRRPIVTWWRYPQKCKDAGHLVVASGIEPGTNLGSLVLIQDPWPVEIGNTYWLTWRGFACGLQLSGHCVDYYDVQKSEGAPASCDASQPLDNTDCSQPSAEPAYQLSDVAATVASTLRDNPSIRHAIGVPDEFQDLACNPQQLLRSARITFAPDGSEIVDKIGTSRLLCAARTSRASIGISIFLKDRGTNTWTIAGFGARQVTTFLQLYAKPLLRGQPGAPELYEVEIPSTGDILLIAPNLADRPTIHFPLDQPHDTPLVPSEQQPRSLKIVLGNDKVGGVKSETLGSYLFALQKTLQSDNKE